MRWTHTHTPIRTNDTLWGKCVRPSWSLWGTYRQTDRHTHTGKFIFCPCTALDRQQNVPALSYNVWLTNTSVANSLYRLIYSQVQFSFNNSIYSSQVPLGTSSVVWLLSVRPHIPCLSTTQNSTTRNLTIWYRKQIARQLRTQCRWHNSVTLKLFIRAPILPLHGPIN